MGVWLDLKLNFDEHVSRSCAKASKMVANLSRLMDKCNSSASKKSFLMSISRSIILYGCAIWGESLNHTARNKLVTIQCVAALRITQAYWTVIITAILVIDVQHSLVWIWWNQEHNELEVMAGRITSGNIIGFMIECEINFIKMTNFVTKI